ncbi:MAG: SEC-C domain-containing protein [Proteobacteria bacterium]|nr:SEC-C domain-containing protein [Pseudomonadota bacterium]
MVAIGRNDPCPCGSGKKYKHCCLGKEPPPRRSSLMDELKAAIAGKTFQSLDEANAFAQAFTESKNRVSQLDFLGLSSEQMHRLLDFPFVRTREIVDIDMDLAPAAFRGIPVVDNALLFLGRLAEQEPLKATAKGNIPLPFAREVLAELKMPERELHITSIRTEEDVPILHALRELLTLCGWVKKRNSRFSLTENGRKIVQRGFIGADFRNLLETFTLKFNWGFMDRYPPFSIVQQSFLFGLYLLHRQAGGEIEEQALADYFLRAFPQVLEDARRYEAPYREPHDFISGCFSLRFLERFCEYFGFVTIRREAISGHFINRKFVQTTDFFRQYLQWRVQ